MIPQVVIVGGGFGGLYAARALSKAPVAVTVIDRRNFHVFQPLLYQVATATLNESDIAFPLRGILSKQRNAKVLLAEASGFDLVERRVKLADGEQLIFDYLVVATGATHSYFGKDEWEKWAPGLKTLEDAVEIRRRVLYAFEAAERCTDPVEREKWLNFVVIGAGPTGIELAGAVAEFARKTVKHDFRSIDPTTARVVLLEAGPRIAAAYDADLSASALKQLNALGVHVRTGAKVTRVDENGVHLGDQYIPTNCVLWGAGVRASPLGKSLGVPLDRAGRVLVTPNLNVPNHDNVFVIGDLAAYYQDGRMVPGVAPAAMQMGRYVADDIARQVRRQPRKKFNYWDKGSMATIGRSAAIAKLPGGIKLTGFFAWFAWLFIHVAFLLLFRQRMMVLLQWFISYVTWQRSARLITGQVANVRLQPAQPSTPAQLPPASEKQKALK